MPENTNERFLKISDAIWIAAFTAAAYAIAFTYEAAYARHFHLPTGLIGISPTVLLKVGGGLLIASLPSYAAFYTVWPLLPQSDTAVAKTIRSVALQILCAAFVMSPFLIFLDMVAWVLFAVLVSLFVLFDVVIPLVAQRRIPTLEGKLNASQASRSTYVTPLSIFQSRLGRGPLLFVMMSVFTVGFANSYGHQQAKSETQFLLVKGAPNVALLAQYDDVFITQEFDPTTKKLLGYFKISRLGDGKDIELMPARVGPLVPVSAQELASPQVKKAADFQSTP